MKIKSKHIIEKWINLSCVKNLLKSDIKVKKIIIDI